MRNLLTGAKNYYILDSAIENKDDFMKKEKRFDMFKKTQKPAWYMVALERILTFFWLTYEKLFKGLKIDRSETKNIRGPVFCVSNHASMIDFPIAVAALKPLKVTWVAAIEEFDGKEWLFRKMGMIPKRKFTHGTVTAKHIMRAVMKEKIPVVIYPEARFVVGGIGECIDGGMGKMVKIMGVPVIRLSIENNFLRSPQWCKHPYRDIPVTAKTSVLITAEETKTLTPEQIQERLEKSFVYDQYAYQYEHKLWMKSKNRALNIHKILYKCPHCGAEYQTDSDGTHIWCNACGHKWEMDGYSRLHATEGETYFEHVPDWYLCERAEVRKEIEAGTYCFEDAVRVTHHINSREMRYEGTVRCRHDKDGFTFSGKMDNGETFELNKSVASMYSLHIDYNFRKQGNAFDIATDNESYFMYPVVHTNPLTKLQFAVEELYNYYVREPEEEAKKQRLQLAEKQSEEAAK